MNILFLINCNDIGGAEFVSYYHVKAAKEANINHIVLSGEKGIFFDKLVELGVKVIHAPQLNGTNRALINEMLLKYLPWADVVMNENWFHVTQFIAPFKNRFHFRYCTIVHSNIDWVMNQLKPFDSITDRYYSIHGLISDTLKKNRIGLNKTFIIPNCIDSALIENRNVKKNKELRKKYNIPETDLVIGMISRIAADKNILDAIRIVETVNLVKSATLVIIGDAPDNKASLEYKNQCQKLINSSEFSLKFKILGKMEIGLVYQHLHLIDIGLNTSPSEGLPISLLEMMCAGIYCIFPSIGDIPNELEGRGKVISIKQRLISSEIFSANCYSVQERMQFINTIINLDLKEANKIGNIARNYILSNRDISSQNRMFLNFLKFEAMNKPTITVMMPVYKVNIDHLKQAVKSILDQTYRSFELMIINGDNDKATDSFLNSIDDPRVNVVNRKDNGLPDARNYCLKNASGTHIICMDSDDIAFRDLIEKHVTFFTKNQNATICGVQIKCFGDANFTTHHPQKVTRKIAAENRNYWFLNQPGVCYKKEIALSLGGYNVELKNMPEDYDLWCKFLENGYEIFNHLEPLVYYRVAPRTRQTPEWFKFLEDRRKSLEQ